MVLEFPVMAEYMIMYLENRMVFVTHGHKFNTSNPPMLRIMIFLFMDTLMFRLWKR